VAQVDPAICEYRIEGREDGPTLVFIHGWPDNPSLWRWQVAALGAEFRCVLLTLPNYGEHAVRAGGFDFPELVDRIAATIRKVQPDGQVGLVTHDWGAYLGYLVEQAHPESVSRMAALDIGGHLGAPGLRSALMIMGYQWALIAAWLVGGVIPPLGRLMTRAVAKVIRVPSRQRAAIRSRYNYLYFYLWRNMLLPWTRRRQLQNYLPGCPVLYLFGERKPVMFHSPQWLRIVADTGGRAEGIADAGHWFMETHPDIVNAELADWFSAPPSEDVAEPLPEKQEPRP
jgi:pimeloyl-ACP methyl ester carboxylesterase